VSDLALNVLAPRPPHIFGGGLPAEPAEARVAGSLVLGAAALAAGALCADLLVRRYQPAPTRRERRVRGASNHPDRPVRGLHAASALLSASVLADSGVEHYRGAYENPGMFAPILSSLLSLVAGAEGAAAGRAPRRLRDGIYGIAAAVGTVGLGFHLYNLLRRPGGLNWQNAFYGAPIGAPAALTLAGTLGLAADRIEQTPSGERPKLLGLPAGRALAALTSATLLGTVSEVALLHFRGSFQNPFMWLPVSLPPVAAGLMGRVAAERTAPRRRPLTRAWLALTAALGIGGVGFHAFGVSRGMGGWRNWTQNLVDGPPLPAPPSFSALALAGLAALGLRDREG